MDRNGQNIIGMSRDIFPFGQMDMWNFGQISLFYAHISVQNVPGKNGKSDPVHSVHLSKMPN
jgi:hypothetical protein